MVEGVGQPGAAVVTDDGWLRPVGHGGSAVTGWTRLGTLDGPGEAIVDPCGVTQVAPGSPGIAWWIAGDDRWYFPSREKTVRQSLAHNTPVVETKMRIKGGDVCLSTYAVTVSGLNGLREVVVAEVENTTGVPCGVAFAVRPFGVSDDVPIQQVSIDGGVIRADGAPVLVLPREPAGALGGSGLSGDLVDQVTLGEATGTSFEPVLCADGRAQAVVVVPLAHRNVFRVVLPIPRPDGTFEPGDELFPQGIPPAENVARGWRAQVRDLARVTVADPRLQAVCEAAPAWLLATTNHRRAAIGRSAWDPDPSPRWHHVAAVAGALDRLGLHERSGLVLARAAAAYLDQPTPDAAWLLGAFGEHVARSADAGFAEAVVDVCAQIIATIDDGHDDSADGWYRLWAFRAAADVFARAGQKSAASAAAKAAHAASRRGAVESASAVSVGLDRCSEVLRARFALAEGDGSGAWEMLDRQLDAVSSTGVWADGSESAHDRHSVGVSAAVIALACDFFAVADRESLRLIAHVPSAWIGRSLQAEQISAPSGSVGYAVRWHEDRPAVLWELGGRKGIAEAEAQIDVTAPGLDVSWHGEGASGEALLGAHEMPATATSGGSRITGLQIGPSRGGS